MASATSRYDNSLSGGEQSFISYNGAFVGQQLINFEKGYQRDINIRKVTFREVLNLLVETKVSSIHKE